MKVLIQWATRRPADWQSVDAGDISRLPAKGQSARLDNRPGWINAINIQGVIISGWDLYNFTSGDGWVEVACWSEADQPHRAMTWRFENLAPDPEYGGAWNTRQTHWYHAELPEGGQTFRGKMLPDALYKEHKARQSSHGWMEWTEGVPTSEVKGGVLREQRPRNWRKPDGTRTYWLTDVPYVQADLTSDLEYEATDINPGPGSATVSIAPRKSGVDYISWTAIGPAVIDTPWVAGTYRVVMNVSAASALVSYDYGNQTGIVQYNLTTGIKQRKVYLGQPKTGTGIKEFDWPTVWGDDTSVDDQCVAWLTVYNDDSKDAGLFEVLVDNTDSFIDGPWASAVASDDLTGDSTTHGHTVDAGTLGQIHVLPADDTTHAHTVDGVPIGQVHVLAGANTRHGHTVDAATLSESDVLAGDSTRHAHTVDAATLGQQHVLPADGTRHGHKVDGVPLGQIHVLTGDSTTHAHTATEPALSETDVLEADNTTHGHTVDAVTLGQIHAFVVGSITHGHTAAAPSLGQIHGLIGDGTTHGHTVDAPTLGQTQHALIVDDAIHAHTVAEPVLGQTHVLAVPSVFHEHTVGGAVLGGGPLAAPAQLIVFQK